MTYYIQVRPTHDRYGREYHGHEGWESLDGEHETLRSAQEGVEGLRALGEDAGTDWAALSYRILDHDTGEEQ